MLNKMFNFILKFRYLILVIFYCFLTSQCRNRPNLNDKDLNLDNLLLSSKYSKYTCKNANCSNKANGKNLLCFKCQTNRKPDNYSKFKCSKCRKSNINNKEVACCNLCLNIEKLNIVKIKTFSDLNVKNLQDISINDAKKLLKELNNNKLFSGFNNNHPLKIFLIKRSIEITDFTKYVIKDDFDFKSNYKTINNQKIGNINNKKAFADYINYLNSPNKKHNIFSKYIDEDFAKFNKIANFNESSIYSNLKSTTEGTTKFSFAYKILHEINNNSNVIPLLKKAIELKLIKLNHEVDYVRKNIKYSKTPLNLAFDEFIEDPHSSKLLEFLLIEKKMTITQTQKNIFIKKLENEIKKRKSLCNFVKNILNIWETYLKNDVYDNELSFYSEAELTKNEIDNIGLKNEIKTNNENIGKFNNFKNVLYRLASGENLPFNKNYNFVERYCHFSDIWQLNGQTSKKSFYNFKLNLLKFLIRKKFVKTTLFFVPCGATVPGDFIPYLDNKKFYDPEYQDYFKKLTNLYVKSKYLHKIMINKFKESENELLYPRQLKSYLNNDIPRLNGMLNLIKSI